MRIKTISVCLYAIINIAADASGDEYSRALDLAVRERFVDYCGVAAIGSGSSPRPPSPLLMKNVAFRVENGLSDYVFRRDFQQRLESMESSGLAGDRRGFLDTAKELTKMIAGLSPSGGASFPDRERFPECVERLEYALVRVLLSGKVDLAPDDIIEIVPDRIFRPWKRVCRDSCGKYTIFRNLIAIGTGIERFRALHGRLPDCLAEMPSFGAISCDVSGMHCDYRMENGVWEVFCGGPLVKLSDFKFDEYVPLLSGKPSYEWRYGGCVWLSSTFQKKRKSLYEGAVLNKNTEWQCRMAGNDVVR